MTREDNEKLFDPDDPDLTDYFPYGGTSGHSGSETSAERAAVADESGITTERDRMTYDRVVAAGAEGRTWYEIGDATGMHHGEVSGCLTRLHQRKHVCRLQEARGRGGRGKRSQVYVLPRHVNGRPESPYKPNVTKRVLADTLTELDNLLRVGDTVKARSLIHRTLATYIDDTT